jgi:hypothetical protein
MSPPLDVARRASGSNRVRGLKVAAAAAVHGTTVPARRGMGRHPSPPPQTVCPPLSIGLGPARPAATGRRHRHFAAAGVRVYLGAGRLAASPPTGGDKGQPLLLADLSQRTRTRGPLVAPGSSSAGVILTSRRGLFPRGRVPLPLVPTPRARRRAYSSKPPKAPCQPAESVRFGGL